MQVTSAFVSVGKACGSSISFAAANMVLFGADNSMLPGRVAPVRDSAGALGVLAALADHPNMYDELGLLLHVFVTQLCAHPELAAWAAPLVQRFFGRASLSPALFADEMLRDICTCRQRIAVSQNGHVGWSTADFEEACDECVRESSFVKLLQYEQSAARLAVWRNKFLPLMLLAKRPGTLVGKAIAAALSGSTPEHAARRQMSFSCLAEEAKSPAHQSVLSVMQALHGADKHAFQAAAVRSGMPWLVGMAVSK